MKKIVSFFLCFGCAITITSAQKITDAEVPTPTIQTFKTKFPNATKIVWEKDSSKYEASFVSNEVNTETIISDKGLWTETEWAIPMEYTPVAMKSYITDSMPGFKLKETTITERAEGKFYVLEVNKKKINQEVWFTLEGNFVRKVNEKPEKKEGKKN